MLRKKLCVCVCGGGGGISLPLLSIELSVPLLPFFYPSQLQRVLLPWPKKIGAVKYS